MPRSWTQIQQTMKDSLVINSLRFRGLPVDSAALLDTVAAHIYLPGVSLARVQLRHECDSPHPQPLVPGLNVLRCIPDVCGTQIRIGRIS